MTHSEKYVFIKKAGFFDMLRNLGAQGMEYDEERNLFIDPKDPDGGAWFFHGTAPQHRKSIKERGITPEEAAEHNMGKVVDAKGKITGNIKRNKSQKASVHLTPYRHYAQAFGHFKPDGGHSNKADLYSTYLTNEEIKKKLRLKNPGYSGLFGYDISSPELLHEGSIDYNKLRRESRYVPDEHKRFKKYLKKLKKMNKDSDKDMGTLFQEQSQKENEELTDKLKSLGVKYIPKSQLHD